MARALLAVLVLTLAAVLGTAPAGASAAAVAVPYDGAEGWAPRAPGWLDPAPRGRAFATGDGPRALPRRTLPTRPTRRVSRAPARPRGPVPIKASLDRLGRRQTDGG
jgi:hypothetical protein